MKNLKKTLALALVFMLTPFISNAQEMAVTLEFQNAETALEVVKKYTKALQSGDVATMDAQLAANAMVYGLGGGLDSLTKAQHTAYYTNSTNKFKHSLSGELFLPVKVTNNWNEGEWVLSWGTNTITDKTTGKVITVPYHTAGRIMDGKIAFLRYWYDMLNVLESQGYEIKAPSK
ncbi:nuclear transport factor 2 family protein [Rhodonellum sp.]|uniref:nuclear transport factor 2 family protein n=1 Tax=Rhodonellum sp. TaxID=2231180 RepID=UPI00271E3605|nr:nuclear transport factor 2 family protein [Rhodonellum sp.]MDO9553506.1 nuclear transport factor 2 family protein [Rhodonellum sp.]